MSLNNQIQNPNFLSKINFRFILKRAPKVTYFTTATVIPGINLPVAKQETPFLNVSLPGHKLSHNPFIIRFLVDENFENYLELLSWMKAIGLEQNFEDYRNLKSNHISTGESVVSDGSLIVDKSSNKPNFAVDFYDLFPISLSDVDFDTQVETDTPVTCIAQFQYRNFKITRNL
jgi:hypothetical protein